ncbi:MAG: hypothetical protein ACN6QH_06070 [Pseudomonas sp.]|uniref:hypothetical protein n=1 Tax=Pseudomonas sp. TaxID=306 RepID=UPI003D13B27C
MSEGTKLAGSESAQATGPRFYVVSIKKLIWLSLLSTGIYLFYWLYRNWATYRDATGDRVIPLLRSIIPVLFIYPLLSRIDQALKNSGSQHEWSPKLLAVGMWLLVIIGVGSALLTPEPSGELKHDVGLTLRYLIETIVQLLAAVWLLCKIQRAINIAECDPEGESNSSYTGANIGWMTFGTVIWVINFIGIMMLLSLAN